MNRYYVSSYKSPSSGITVWQVIDRITGQWVFEAAYKPSCVEHCRKLNVIAGAVTV